MRSDEWAALTVREQADIVRKKVGTEPDEELATLLEALDGVLAANPLEGFAPHKCAKCKTYAGDGCVEHLVPQVDFFGADTQIVALFAGNQFGKTAALVVRAILECLPDQLVPERLKGFKHRHGPTFGWILAPTEEKIYDSILPTFQEWMPAQGYKGGSFDKGWNGSRMMLTFVNGSYISFKTYKQHESTLGGARLMFVGYDEPPPREHRDEAMTRLLRYGGYEMFAMTPLKTNTGWIRRDIYKQRESPDITVIRASMHDNPTLDAKTKKHILSQYASDLWRKAREFGDFVDVGGLIYQDFARIIVPPPDGDFVRMLDPVVGIDPGVRNAAFIFGGFDNDNTLGVFDELLIQDGTVDDYATGITTVLKRWGLKQSQVTFVIDPAARARGQVNAETVEGALSRLGIYCVHGQNDVPAGVQQIRSRIQHKRIWVSQDCRGLIDEADEYAAEDRDDGEFKPIKQNDHRLDATRYLSLYRPYDHIEEEKAAEPKLGWKPGYAPPGRWLTPQPDLVPNGFMS